MSEISVNLAYNKIQVLSFNLNIPEGLKIQTDKKDLFRFNYSVNTKPILEKELYIVNLDINVLYGKEQKIICTLKISYDYNVIGLKKIVKKKEKKIFIPEQLHSILIANAVSTSRGILLMKTAGSPLENIYLPIVKPDSFSKVSKIDRAK